MSKDVILRVLQRVETPAKKNVKAKAYVQEDSRSYSLLRWWPAGCKFRCKPQTDNRPFLRVWPYQQSMARGYDHGNF